MNRKTIIFVGGSPYSGSTILDMMIASGNAGFSLGEANALFHPYREHHLSPTCGCGNNQCRLWYDLKKERPDSLYKNIFMLYPKTEFIVDSSKEPFWIKEQTRVAKKQGYDVKNVLIWKNSKGFALSQLKRGNSYKWEKNWINYYRLYYAVIDNFISINYERLVKNPKHILKSICELIGIDYFEGKEFYWNFEHHTLFGNNSAKVHLYSEETNGYQRCEDELKQLNPTYLKNNHRKIHYDSDKLNTLPDHVQKQVVNDKKIQGIEKLLTISDKLSLSEVNSNSELIQLKNEIKFNVVSIFLRAIYRRFKLIFKIGYMAS